MTARARAFALGLALLAAACSAQTVRPGGGGESAGEGGEGGDGADAGGGEADAGGGEGVNGGDDVDAGPARDGAASDEELAGAARAVLYGRCSGCHRGTHCGSTGGGLGREFDVAAMIDCGNLVPGDADGSVLWRRVERGDMPPAGGLSRIEKDALRAWIDGGAPALPQR